MELSIRQVAAVAPDALDAEIVERKGKGHPDSICDALCEAVSGALCRYYVEHFGFVLHHNVDKALLWGGSAEPAFGGGTVTKPIEIFIAGRAAFEYGGTAVPVDEIAVETAGAWLRANMHALDPDRHVKIHPLIRPGSKDLVELFLRQQKVGAVLANDTSCGTGFAPLSETEAAVLEIERHLNAPDVRRAHPEIGEDIKVMGVRRGGKLRITIACALVGRFLSGPDTYFAAKERIAGLARDVAKRFTEREVSVEVNTADAPDGSSLYVTVTGTSAEAGDDGEAGRGNRANGLITPYRPMTMESIAGKNPISHVGKLYNLTAGLISAQIADGVTGVEGVHCVLVSQIGHPIKEPQIVDIALFAKPGTADKARGDIRAIVGRELDALDGLWRDVLAGAVQIDGWPFRAA
ncbi:MAG: methionine adenosyltransferase [Alphaproteobacteria bacterium]